MKADRLEVFLFHAAADHTVAAAVAERLELFASAQVHLEECGSNAGETVADVWDTGLNSSAILLLVSPHSVPPRGTREEWASILDHREHNAAPPLGLIAIGDCKYPRLLERKQFFRWNRQSHRVLRDLTHWISNLQIRSESSFVPARLPWFQDRQPEIDRLWETLVDEAGVTVLANSPPGSGKTALAHEFVRLSASHFHDVFWLQCGRRSEISIAGELASSLGVSLGTNGEDALARVGALVQDRRVLLVFDDLPAGFSIATACGGRASVLVTTRVEDNPLLAGAETISIGSADLPTPDPNALTPAARHLWDAMQACSPQGFPLALAVRVARLDEEESRSACLQLIEQRWIDPMDSAGVRYRLGGGAYTSHNPESAIEARKRWHAEAVAEYFSKWSNDPALCRDLLIEMDAAFQWALRSHWRLATSIAHRAFAFLKSEIRLAEAVDIYKQVIHAAYERGDQQEIDDCAWELSWIEDCGGGLRRSTVHAEQTAFNFADESNQEL